MPLRLPPAIVFCALLAPLLLAACGGRPSAATTTTSTSPIGPPPAAIGPPTRADLADVRRAVAHTLTQKAVVSVEVVNRTSVTWPVIKGSGSFDLREATGQVVVQNPNGYESLVFQPAAVFDKPAGGGSLPQGRPWVRADFKEPLSDVFVRQFLLGCESVDAGFFLAEVAWGAKAAAPLGPRLVNHRPTTGYLVRVDLAHAVAAATGPKAKSFVRTATLLERIARRHGRGTEQTVRVWVDRSGRVVAIRAFLPATGIGDSLITVTSFGRLAVDPVPPSRDQFVDLASLTAAGDNDND